MEGAVEYIAIPMDRQHRKHVYAKGVAEDTYWKNHQGQKQAPFRAAKKNVASEQAGHKQSQIGADAATLLCNMNGLVWEKKERPFPVERGTACAQHPGINFSGGMLKSDFQ